MIEGIILAAGLGERMMPLTKDLPKPMLRINNKPILEYIIELLKKNGIKNILITTYHHKEKIIDYFGNGEKFGVNIQYLKQERLNSSANAIKQVVNLIKDPVLVFNGDNFTNIDLRGLIKFHELRGADVTLCAYYKKDDSSGYLDFNPKGELKGFVEKVSSEDIEKIPLAKRFSSMGIYIFKKEVLDSIPSDTKLDLGEFFSSFLSKKYKIFVYKKDDKAYYKEVGKLERFYEAKKEIENGEVVL